MTVVPPFGRQPNSVLMVGEAPGCVSGSTLIETAFRDKSKYPDGIPIRDLVGQSGFRVYSFDVDTQDLALGRVSRVWKTGRKKVYRVTYEWAFALKKERIILRESVLVTSSHQFLLKRRSDSQDPFASRVPVKKGIDYMSLDEGLSVGHSLQPFHRRHDKTYGYAHIGPSSLKMRREGRYLLAQRLRRELQREEECHHKDENKLNDEASNLVRLTTTQHARVHTSRMNPMDRLGARDNHRKALMSEAYRSNLSNKLRAHLADPRNYEKRLKQINRQRRRTSETVRLKFATDPVYYWNYLQGRMKRLSVGEEWAISLFKQKFPGQDPPIDNHRVISIEHVGYVDVYDISVRRYKNFAAHRIFLHNSSEAAAGRPFIGLSGKYQKDCLQRRDIDVEKFRLANVVGLFRKGNPDPDKDLIREWTPHLEAEIRATNPRLIVAVGDFSLKWFLGEQATLGTCWGVCWPGGYFDPSIVHRANGAAVLPVFHPAYALRTMSEGGDKAARAIELVQAGYDRIAVAIKQLEAGKPLQLAEDEFVGHEQYRDVTAKQLAAATKKALLAAKRAGPQLIVGFDTEGEPGDEWSLQVSFKPGTGLCLRREQPDFAVGVSALQQAANAGALFVMHCASTPRGTGYDLTMASGMGLNLSRAQIWDTMFAAYLLRNEPHGAKALGLRWCSMRMRDFDDLIGPRAREHQVNWLCSVLERDWPPPETRVEIDNAGVSSLYTPNSVEKRVEKMLVAIYKDGKDPLDCWKNMDSLLAKQVERELGPMPRPNIRMAPLDEAVAYAARDSDFELRAYYRLGAELERLQLTRTMSASMKVLPAFQLIQVTGMPASRKLLVEGRDQLQQEMNRLRRSISRNYFSGKPINPMSGDQVIKLMLRRGLESTERTKTGKWSTGKKAVEHLRYVDEAMGLVAELREKAKNKDGYYEPLLELMDEHQDIQIVHANIKPINTTTRRLATTDPSLLSFPKHDKPGGFSYGKRLRSCFVCAPGEVFAEIDASQIEARMLAHESEDPVLCQMFIDGRDIHTETAAKMFGIPLKDMERLLKEAKESSKAGKPLTEAMKLAELQRFLAKKITFGGVMYGQTGMGLATQLRMMNIQGYDAEKCDGFKKDWMRLHKRAAEYIRWAEEDVMKTGEVRDCWGMLRYLPAVWADTSQRAGRSLVAEAKRQAINHRIQGSAQGLLQNGLAWWYPKLLDRQARGENVQLCLSVHDSLLLRLDEKLYDEVSLEVVEALTQHNGLAMRIPVLADRKAARSWGQL